MRWSPLFLVLILGMIMSQCTPKKGKDMSATAIDINDFRKTPPGPGQAPTLELGKYEQFALDNGLQVILVQNNKLPRISIQLLVDFVPLNQGDNAGYISMVTDLMLRGTEERSKKEIDEEVDFMGANLSAGSNSLFISGLSRHKETLFSLLSEVLIQPSFPEEELEKLRRQYLSGLAASKEDPNTIAANVSKVLRFGKMHPFGELVTEESLENIKLSIIERYHDFILRPEHSYLAIVGDISKEEAKVLVEQYFGKWERGKMEASPPAKPKFTDQRRVFMVDRPGAVQSVVSLTYPLEFSYTAEDYMAAKLMNTMLGGFFSSRINMNVREDKGYTYGARSTLSPNRYVSYFSAGGAFGTDVTEAAIQEIIFEMDRMRTEPISESELALVKAAAAGDFARSLERPQTIAGFALNIARFGLPIDFYDTYLERLEAVSADDILKAARKYIRPSQMHVLVVGNAEALSESLKRFDFNNEVRMLDEYGDPVGELKLINPPGLTPVAVLERYIASIGGEELIRSLKSLEVNSKGEISGMALDSRTVYVFPDKMAQELSSLGNPVQSQIINGKRLSINQMGRTQVLEGDEYAGLLKQADLFHELKLLELADYMQLKKPQVVNGRKCYHIEIKYNDGQSYYLFFDMETGFKIREDNPLVLGDMETRQFMDFDKYEPTADGLVFAMKMTLTGPSMPTPLNMYVQELRVNPDVDMNLFKIE